MRERCRLSFAALVATFALAAQPAPLAAAMTNGCGRNSQDAIAIAEKALESNSPEVQRRTLTCLIAAIKLFTSEGPPRIISKESREFFLPPQHSGGPGGK